MYEGPFVWELNTHKEWVSKGILVQRIRATIHREPVHQISDLYKHAQHNSSLINGIECM